MTNFSNALNSDFHTVRRVHGTLAFLSLSFVLFLLPEGSHAQQSISISLPNPTAEQLGQQELTQLLLKKLPKLQPEAIERIGREFQEHLHETSPIISENFTAGRMSEDDLASSLDIFIGDHPEYTGQASGLSKADPVQRVAELLKDSPDLARTDSDRRSLADRFVEQLGNLSGTARNDLIAGRMSQDELQSRVSVFVADTRAEAAHVAADPAVEAVPPIVDAYIKANFGSASEQINSIIYRGFVEENSVKREFVMFKMRPRLLRIHVVDNGRVIGVMGFDGRTPWAESPGKLPIPVTGHEAEVLAATSRFDDPLVGYKERGARVRLLDRPSSGPIQLQILESDGTEMVASIDPVTSIEQSFRTRRSDGRWNEMRFRDYRREGSINVAHVTEEWTDGVLHSTTRYSEVRLDPGLVDRFFVRPSSLAFDYMDFMGGLAVLESREKQAAGIAPLKIAPVQ
jgi:uncharacterized tellurite resistance protein B-like protein